MTTPTTRGSAGYTIRAKTHIAEAKILDQQALVRGTAEKRVKVATGAAGELFVGFANQPANIGQSVGAVTIGQVTPITDVDVVGGDLLKLSPAGHVTKAAAGDKAVGRAEYDAVAGRPCTMEVAGTY